MNGYEIMRRNIEFDHPDRIGLRFNSFGVSDVYRIFVQPAAEFRGPDAPPVSVRKKAKVPPGTNDEWGCTWDVLPGQGANIGQVVNHPLTDWALLDEFAFPDPTAPGRFDGLAEALAEAETKGLYVQLNSPFCLFERMHFLRRLDLMLMDTVLEPDKVGELADRVIDYQIGIVAEAQRLSGGRIHCFDTTDDWGTQTGMMISPASWREIFKPRYKRLMDALKAAGMTIRFHTDGKVNDIYPDLIEIGVDIINIHQPRLLGIEEVGAKFAGQVCFEVSVDIQDTLPGGDRQAIEAEAKAIVERLGTPKGGLIAVEYRYLDAIGATEESLRWALEAFQKYGKLK
ncbi:MAG: hypothetical protein FOGNACKC_06366 [Anaerolineae bacterium]|nr:hypothetical protein [Anaerolineae bacterium]